MLLTFLSRRGKISVFPSIFRSVRKIFLSMAASNDESNKENVADGEVEQIVTIETVVAADNKGIDYDKLISESLSLLILLFPHIFAEFMPLRFFTLQIRVVSKY